MKFILFLIFAFLFSGCESFSERRVKNIDKSVKALSDGNKIVCHHKIGFRSSDYVDGIIFDKNNSILINNNTKIVDIKLENSSYSLEHCVPIVEKVVFNINNIPYIMINGVISPIKGS